MFYFRNSIQIFFFKNHAWLLLIVIYIIKQNPSPRKNVFKCKILDIIYDIWITFVTKQFEISYYLILKLNICLDEWTTSSIHVVQYPTTTHLFIITFPWIIQLFWIHLFCTLLDFPTSLFSSIVQIIQIIQIITHP